MIYANFYREDPLKCGYIKKPDQLLPFYTVSKLAVYPGVPGLIIAGIFSGSLSTVSSFVNSLSAVTLEDYLKPVFQKTSFFKNNEILITKILAFFYGCLCISLTYVADKMVGLLQASLTLFGVVGGPLLMLFTVGMCFPSTNSTGAMTGFVSSLLFAIWIGFGGLFFGRRPVPLPTSDELCRINGTASNTIFYFKPTKEQFIPSSFFFYNLSYMWLAALSWAVGVIVALLVSWWTNQRKEKINECSQPASISSAIQSKVDQILLMPLLQQRNDSLPPDITNEINSIK